VKSYEDQLRAQACSVCGPNFVGRCPHKIQSLDPRPGFVMDGVKPRRVEALDPRSAPVKRTPSDWDLFYFSMAQLVQTRSKDPERRVGAVLVTANRRQLSIGYNGLPGGIPDDPRTLGDREEKLRLMVHAEQNCLKQAPFPPAGASLYVTRFPCGECATLITTAKVARVVAPRFDHGHPRWGSSWLTALARFNFHGLAVLFVDDLHA
jgi:dCMP deaminase